MFPTHLHSEWSLENVRPLTSYTPDSLYRAWWVCSVGHEWQARIANRTRTNKCPRCYPRDTLADYPRLVAEWSDKNERPMSSYKIASTDLVWWICSRRHEWRAGIDSRTRKDRPTACPQCFGHAPRQDKITDYPHLIAQWSPRNESPITDYKPGSGYKAWWICSVNPEHEWQADIIRRVGGNPKGKFPRKATGCPHCFDYHRRKDNLSDNAQLAAEWSDKNQNSIDYYTPGSRYKAWWICPLDHEWQARIDLRAGLRATGCPHCAQDRKQSKRKPKRKQRKQRCDSEDEED